MTFGRSIFILRGSLQKFLQRFSRFIDADLFNAVSFGRDTFGNARLHLFRRLNYSNSRP